MANREGNYDFYINEQYDEGAKRPQEEYMLWGDVPKVRLLICILEEVHGYLISSEVAARCKSMIGQQFIYYQKRNHPL